MPAITASRSPTRPAAAAPPPAWAGVQPRHLESLAAIARTRSFRGAARVLGYSQSSLSDHVSHLELVLATRLLARRRGSAEVELTPAGELVLGHVEGILGVYRAAEADLDALAAGEPGCLRIAVAGAIGATLLPAVLPPLVAEHPSLGADIRHDGDADAIARDIAAGRLDVAIGPPPSRRHALATRALAPEPYVLAAPASWAVVRAPDATAAGLLEHLPLIRAADDPATTEVERELRARGPILRPATVASGAASLPPLVAAGAGAALLPVCLCPPGQERIVTLPLDGLVSSRAVSVSWHAERRAAPLVDEFVALACAARPAIVAVAA